jgi:hypothetical protein
MPRSRLTPDEIAFARARLAAGESLASVSLAMGRSRQALARIKGAMDRNQSRRLDVKLNLRVTEEERAAFQTVAEAKGLTVSEAARHLVRQASGLLALQADELTGIAAARRELSAVGSNLNQLARLGASGKLAWKPGDSALVRKVAARVDDLSESLVALLAALGSHQAVTLQQAAVAFDAESISGKGEGP